MTALRQTVCSVSLQSGVSGKSPRDAALVRLMRTGERESCTRFGEFRGFVSRRRKAGSLHRFEQNSLIHRLSAIPSTICCGLATDSCITACALAYGSLAQNKQIEEIAE